MRIAGLDIGTTGCKLTAFDNEGECLGRVYREYPNTRSSSGHELDPLRLLDGVMEVLAESAVRWPEIVAIGITSFGETFVMLDENDLPLRPAMLYTDPRGKQECDMLRDAVGKEDLIQITGTNPHAMYSLPKIMWVKHNQPELYKRTKRVCLIADYIVYLLTGNAQTEYSLAARTMAFDLQRLQWSDRVLAAGGINAQLFSALKPTGTSAGNMLPPLAQQFGFSSNPLIVPAGHDQVAAAVGSGVLAEGAAVDGAGTVECITPVFEEFPNLTQMAEGSYAVVPHAVPGKYVSYAFSFTGGAATSWYTRHLMEYPGSRELDQHKLYEALSGMEFLDQPTRLLVLPHFAGAATPYMDSGSKAAILGLTLETTPHDIYCAIMEGVCYEMRINMEKLKQAGVSVCTLNATGGCANNRIWMQIKADVLGIPITALQTIEAGGTGAAMMAGVACNMFTDINDAAAKMVKLSETYTPRALQHMEYNKMFQRYQQLYQAIRPLMDEI